MSQLPALLALTHGSMTPDALFNAVSIPYHFLSNLPILNLLKLEGTSGGLQLSIMLLQGSIRLNVKISSSRRNFSCSSQHLSLLLPQWL